MALGMELGIWFYGLFIPLPFAHATIICNISLYVFTYQKNVVFGVHDFCSLNVLALVADHIEHLF